jgi:hypothetical protein
MVKNALKITRIAAGVSFNAAENFVLYTAGSVDYQDLTGNPDYNPAR